MFSCFHWQLVVYLWKTVSEASSSSTNWLARAFLRSGKIAQQSMCIASRFQIDSQKPSSLLKSTGEQSRKSSICYCFHIARCCFFDFDTTHSSRVEWILSISKCGHLLGKNTKIKSQITTYKVVYLEYRKIARQKCNKQGNKSLSPGFSFILFPPLAIYFL